MKISLHQKYTQEAAGKCKASSEIAKEIVKGSTTNDLCEFTNEYQIFCATKKGGIFHNNAFYQSHYGCLTTLHATAKKSGEDAEITRKEISQWFNFLNGIALGTFTFDPSVEIRSDDTPVKDLFIDTTIPYRKIFDSKDGEIIKTRAIGAMCHLIQDLFTLSHCERNDNNEIVCFYCYGDQDAQKHSNGDQVINGFEEELEKQSTKCIESIFHTIPYNYADILHLSTITKKSNGGIFAK